MIPIYWVTGSSNTFSNLFELDDKQAQLFLPILS